MKFTKVQGLGNDYVYIDCSSEQVARPEELVIRVVDRHFGVGGDGLTLICPSEIAPVRMHMLNVDGSERKMCGNGACCAAYYAYNHGLVTNRSFDIETGAGIRHTEVDESPMTVDMGEAVLDGELEKAITADGKATRVAPVNVGNPRAVYLVSSLEILWRLGPDKIGPAYEHHPRFPGGMDLGFLYIESSAELHMWIYERGGGEILACGANATVVTFVVMRPRRANERITVHFLGGGLVLEQLSNGYFRMTGPAVEVFSGSCFSEW